MNNKENAEAAGSGPAGYRLCDSGNVEMLTEAEVNAVIARIFREAVRSSGLGRVPWGRCTELVCCGER
jgi:hypothetical protein